MQFLFVILMSVLVGASALPHVMQAPNRPSFSLRKNTSFSIVAIPKLFQTVAGLDSKLATLEAEQNKKKFAVEEAKRMEELKSNQDSSDDNAPASDDSSERAPASVSVTTPKGVLVLDNFDVQACVCKGKNLMDCKVWVDGYCSQEDEYIGVTAAVDNQQEVTKNFRCKELNHFSGTLAVEGSGVGKVTVNFMDQKFEQHINLINYCGELGTISPQDDE